jgi:hypothetical protein
MDLIDIFRIYHPTTVKYTLSASHGSFSKIDFKGHKASLNRYRNDSLDSIKPHWNKLLLNHTGIN